MKKKSHNLARDGGRISFQEALILKKEAVWKNLADIRVHQALDEWLKTLTPLTAKNYRCGIRQLATMQLIDLTLSLQLFALVNHDAVIDAIKTVLRLSECSKQARAACYISFTRFLSRRTQGVIPKATPNREGVSKTFYKVRDKVATHAMTRAEWSDFLDELAQVNARDCLIAKIILQGGKRLGEVLKLTTDRIDYSKREITFTQSKTKGYEKQTVITYPQSIMDELKETIGKRSGYVFVTKFGKGIMPNQLAVTFHKAGVRAGIPFKVTPHVLRASAITYLKVAGYSDSDVMKISGHASSAMVNAYDKSDRAHNISKKVSLV